MSSQLYKRRSKANDAGIMADIPSPRAGAEQHVTASALVRQFGVWQERAARAPVYVLHHGRPRLMLVALDLLETMMAGRGRTGGGATERSLVDAVIDSLDVPVLTLDGNGNVASANRLAHARFGTDVAAGSDVAMLSHASGVFLAEAVRRVLDGGASETVEVIPDRFPQRLLRIAVEPLPGGCLLRADDLTTAEQLRAASAERDATIDALESTGAGAMARISLRGYLVAPRPALSNMTGVPADQLATARFLSLIEVGDRPRVGQALETASGGASVASLRAGLLVRGGTLLKVAIGFSPVRLSGRMEEVVAVITSEASIRRT